jgi:hypothetical protein
MRHTNDNANLVTYVVRMAIPEERLLSVNIVRLLVRTPPRNIYTLRIRVRRLLIGSHMAAVLSGRQARSLIYNTTAAQG